MKKEYLIYKLSEDLKEATRIENELFRKFDVKRGLRNEDGTGVLVGLTKIGNVVGYERIPGGGLKPIPGKLFYRGYDVDDLAHAIIKEKRFGFEEIAYLLLSGRLPDKEELSSFRELINDNMPLEQKTKMNIIELEGNNIMNILARSVLEMYRFDPDADDTSRDNLMRQSIELISKFPTIIAYASPCHPWPFTAYPPSAGKPFHCREFPLYAEEGLHGAGCPHARPAAGSSGRARWW